MDVWNVPEAPPDTASKEIKDYYHRKVLILTWYGDVFIPMTCGVDWFGPNIRPYQLMTDTVSINGEDKVLVTVTSEAYGLLQFENSREVWINNFKYKKQFGQKKTPPQYNSKKKETHIYKSKWSNANTGQCSAWDRNAYAVFEQRKKDIKAFRAQDTENGKPKMKYLQALIKIANNLGMDETGEDERPNKRARIGDDSGEASDDEEVVIEFEDE